MSFEKQEILRLRHTAETSSRDWGYPLRAKPAFILCCELSGRKVTLQVINFSKVLTKQQLTKVSWINDHWVFSKAEQWRQKTFDWLKIEQGRVMFAVCTPSIGVNRELESHLYQWWSAKREFMLGDFHCIHASAAK
ncbi:hypothetical protein M527_14035 [Sphingobium indicum IP26]|nr:hypothetical protein M527_14035 [Sphingobium indicum IP26]